MRETWYVLEDGSALDPKDVTADKSGVLRNKSGMAVAMRGDAHSSRSVDPELERAKTTSRDMKAEDTKKPYRTRDLKGE